MNSKRSSLLTLAPLLALIVTSEILLKRQTEFPKPSSVFSEFTLLISQGVFLSDLLASTQRVTTGFLLASLLGTFLGLIIGRFTLFKILLSSIIEVMRPIPPIAWIPICIVILGIGESSMTAIIFLGAFFPFFTNIHRAITQIDKNLFEMAQVFRCSKILLLKRIIIPSLIPSFFTGAQTALGASWMCVVASEMISASKGFGYTLQLGRQMLNLDLVIVCMISIGVTGVLMREILVKIETFILSKGKCTYKKRGKRKNFHSQFNSPPFLAIEHICFRYPTSNEFIIHDLSFSLESGSILSIIGKSGSGKSTLLKILSGILNVDSGAISTPKESSVSIAFQEPRLLPWYNALENVAFSYECQGLSRVESKANAYEMLSLVGLQDKVDADVSSLSGGEAQRVSLARALSKKPDILLLDEPFASLDCQTKEELQELLSKLQIQFGFSAILVTHDLEEAVFLSDSVLVLKNKQQGETFTFETKERKPRTSDFRYSEKLLRLKKQVRAKLTAKTQSAFKVSPLKSAFGNTLLCFLCFLSIGCKSESSEVARIGWMTSWTSPAVILQTLAHTDIFENEGAKAQLKAFLYGPEINEAARAGEVEITNSGIVPSVSLLSVSDDWLIAGRLIDFSVSLVTNDSKIHSLASLKGKKIGVPFGGGSHPYIIGKLKALGIEQTVTLINMKPSEQELALKSHAVHAIATWEPQTTLAVKRANARVIDGETQSGLILVNRKYLSSNKENVKNILNAYKKANYFVSKHPTQVDSWCAQALRLPIEILSQIPSIERNFSAQSLENINIEVTQKLLEQSQRTADQMFELGLIKKRVRLKERVYLLQTSR